MNLDWIWLVVAGLGGGLAGSVVGLASLVSYPVLLAVGLPPVTANVTNTVALVFSSIGSISASGPELAGQGPRLRHLGAFSLVGGIVGAVLLLATPARSFALVIPWLIGLASIGVLVRRDPDRAVPHPMHRPTRVLSALSFCVAIYSGYFGAAAGVILLTLLIHATGESLARSNAAKNLLLGVSNTIAAVAFAIFGPVRWIDVAPLAVGFIVGGRIGPVVVRHAPTGALRIVIALSGVGLSVHLGIDTYR